MKEYDMNITAMQMIRVKAESEEEAVDKAFYDTFGKDKDSFLSWEHEVVYVDEVE